jgi:hypothetical protein
VETAKNGFWWMLCAAFIAFVTNPFPFLTRWRHNELRQRTYDYSCFGDWLFVDCLPFITVSAKAG